MSMLYRVDVMPAACDRGDCDHTCGERCPSVRDVVEGPVWRKRDGWPACPDAVAAYAVMLGKDVSVTMGDVTVRVFQYQLPRVGLRTGNGHGCMTDVSRWGHGWTWHVECHCGGHAAGYPCVTCEGRHARARAARAAGETVDLRDVVPV